MVLPLCRRWVTTAAASQVVPLKRRTSVIVDGNNVLYHYYSKQMTTHGPCTTTGALGAMIETFHRMAKAKNRSVQSIVVCFDTPKVTVRKLLNKDYKKSYTRTPNPVRAQLNLAPVVLNSFGINSVACPGFEADDVVASYTRALLEDGQQVIVISNDTDMLQLSYDPAEVANDQIHGSGEANTSESKHLVQQDSLTEVDQPKVEVYTPNRRRYHRHRTVRARFGVAPYLIPDLMVLCGRVGNISKHNGVEGLSVDTAVELLQKYSNLPGILRHLNEIQDQSLRRCMKETISAIETSYRMAKLQQDLPLPIPLDELLTFAQEPARSDQVTNVPVGGRMWLHTLTRNQLAQRLEQIEQVALIQTKRAAEAQLEEQPSRVVV